MSEQNKAAMRRLVDEIMNKGNLAVVDELISADAVDHSLMPGQEPGPEGFKKLVTMFRSAFPDLQVTVEDMIAEGDKVVARVTTRGTHKGEFMGIPPTGKPVTVPEIHIVRIAGGKMVEPWGIEDNMAMMQQLGVISPPG